MTVRAATRCHWCGTPHQDHNGNPQHCTHCDRPCRQGDRCDKCTAMKVAELP